MTIEYLSILDLTVFLSLVSILLGVWRWKSLNAGDKIILSVVFIVFFQELFILLFSKENETDLFAYNIGFLIKFLLFFLYFRVKSPQKWIRISSLFLIPIIIIWGVVNLTWVQGTSNFNTLTYIPNAFLIGLFSYLNLRRLIISDSISKQNMQLWILIANCIYFFVTIPIEGMSPFIKKFSLPLAEELRLVPAIFENIWLIMITLGFLWKKRSRI